MFQYTDNVSATAVYKLLDLEFLPQNYLHQWSLSSEHSDKSQQIEMVPKWTMEVWKDKDGLDLTRFSL